MCWNYACASMLRASCTILIKKLYKARIINKQRKKECIEFIRRPEVHHIIRNLVAMILVPKKLHLHDDSQAAFLEAAVSRVSHLNQLNQYFRLQTQLYWKNQAR